MKTKSNLFSRKAIVVTVSSVVVVIGCWVAWKQIEAVLEMRRAEDSIVRSIRAVLAGDMKAMKELQLGDEFDRLGVSEATFVEYSKNLLAGYIAPDAEIKAVRDDHALWAPKNDAERKMLEDIRSERRYRPYFDVTVSRIDGKLPISFKTFASRGPDGWAVSPPAMLSWLQAMYSDDLIVRYCHIEEALEKSNLERICTPSGVWISRTKIALFLRGEITEKDIYKRN